MPAQHVEQFGQLVGLVEAAVHAQREAVLQHAAPPVGRQGIHRQVAEFGPGADLADGLVAVHHRHLQVHQHQGVVIRRLGAQLGEGVAAVGGGVHLDTPAAQQRHRHVAAGGVVLDEQHAHPIQGAGGHATARLLRLQAQHDATQLAQGAGQERAVAEVQAAGAQLGHVLAEGPRHRHQGDVGGHQLGLLAEGAHDGAAVEIGQRPVEEHQVVGSIRGPRGAQAGHHLAAAADRFHVVDAFDVEQVDEGQPGLGVILGDQHAHRRQGRRRARRLVAVAGQGDLDLEAAAGARRALHADLAAHRLDQPADDGEPQPGAAVLAGGGAVGLDEVVEEELDLLGPHADAGIFNGEADQMPTVVRQLAVYA